MHLEKPQICLSHFQNDMHVKLRKFMESLVQ
jgi:hypothetical protein